jgi:hypothetical protein
MAKETRKSAVGVTIPGKAHCQLNYSLNDKVVQTLVLDKVWQRPARKSNYSEVQTPS